MELFRELFGRPQNLVAMGVVLGMLGLFLSTLGLFQLTRQTSAKNQELAARYSQIDAGMQELARQNANTAARESELESFRHEYEKWQTGGDSYSYVRVAVIAPKTAVRSIVHVGRYPLYDVDVKIVDESTAGKLPEERLHIGYLPPFSSHLFGRWTLPSDRDEQDYILHITARNGSFTQKIHFQCNNGVWVPSMRVSRDSTGEVLLTKTGTRRSNAPPLGSDAERTESGPGRSANGDMVAVEAVPERGWAARQQRLPAVDLLDSEGRIWSGQSLEGKTVLINVWASWCASCVAEHPGIQRLYERFKDDPGVAVLTLNIDQDADRVRAYMNERGYTFPVLFARPLISQIYRSISIPRNWIVDPHGVLRWEQIGFEPQASWEMEAQALVEKTEERR